MKTRRNTGGFTLLELVLAVAIIGILSGVAAVNVVHYQRTLTQVELDGIAREIFVAAQNHLTMAESQGFMGIVDESDWGEPYQKGTTTEPTIYYYVVKPDTDRDSLNMLNLMLPFASVDETVRTADGSYVIRYQKDPALVLDVFYASTNGKFQHTFTEEESTPPPKVTPQPEDTGDTLNTLWDYRGDKKQERGNYPKKIGPAVIGWYGVDPEWFSVQSGSGGGTLGGGGKPIPVPKAEKPLSPPTIKIVNAEQLYVEVSNPNTDEKLFSKAGLRLVVTGIQSGVSFSTDLWKSDKDRNAATKIQEKFTFVLDDVTDKEQDEDGNRNHHFQHVCSGLYPGEDITVYAVAYNNHELTNIAESAHATTNSLFASLERHPTLTLETPATAMISNFRHLENMDSAISNIKIARLLGQECDYYQIDGNNTIQITRVEQTSDMDWNLFKNAVGENILDKNGTVLTANYWPVTNGAGIELYNGKGHKISNVTIKVSGNAGLFAKLGHSSSVTDLELVNFSVISSDKDDGAAGALAGVIEDNSTVTNLKISDCSIQSDSRVWSNGSGAAGGLAGVLDKSTVQSVLVHHDTDKSGDAYKVTGKGSAGGLVGLVQGDSCAIAQSAAAVYVKSTLATGNAGGLIGTVSAGASVTVKDSYAGGHTTTNYEKQNGDKVKGGYKGDYYNIEENSDDHHGHYNVTARASAGGLIGSSMGNLTVNHCYATTSVDGSTNAGGFIGDIEGGTITSCYATGHVTGNDNYKGAFAGKVSGTTFSDSGYFTTVENEEEDKDKEPDKRLKSVGQGDSDGIASFDQDCKKFGGYHAQPNAEPYDPDLGDKYPFQTISELDSGVTSPDWMSTHYGDWPDWLEVLVINELKPEP